MKIKFFLNLVILLVISVQAKSNLPEYLIPGIQFEFKSFVDKSRENNKKIAQIGSVLQKRPYDVLEYDIFLDWYRVLTIPNPIGDNRRYSGLNKITLKVDTTILSSIELDAVNIIIDSVRYAKDKSKLKFVQLQDNLNISLPTNFFRNDTLQIEVYYTYIGKDNRGFYLFDQGHYVGQGPPPKRDSIYVLHRLAYTMSEPQDARYWLPCNDSPDDKAMIKTAVKVPKGYNIATNGLRYDMKTTGDTVIYYYSSKFPMTTYLITVNASKFKFEQDYYVRITNPADTVPIHYYVWDQDWDSDTTDGTAYNAKHSFCNVVRMMQEFSKVYGEYPFEKYGMVAVQPFNFGGMEHQTMTTINRSWLRGYSETGIAHELAHQWLGDLVTCATWFDIWINEGGATWSEAIWYEQLYGKNFYYYYMNQVISRYLQTTTIHNIPIYGVPINSIFNYPIVLLEYNKASWVYHMLRENLGDSTFFGALRYLFDKHKFQSIETIDFLNTFKEYVKNSPIDFDKFFYQWIIKAGHPIFEIHSSSAIGSDYYDIKVNIAQLQEGSNIPQVFEMPIELLLYKDSTINQKQVVYMNQRIQEFNFRTDFRPDSIKINTNKILATVTGNTLSIETFEGNKLQNVSPNPVKIGNNFRIFSKISDNSAIVTFYDLFGRKIKQQTINGLTPGSYELELNSNGLQAGYYLVHITSGNEISTAKMLVVE